MDQLFTLLNTPIGQIITSVALTVIISKVLKSKPNVVSTFNVEQLPTFTQTKRAKFVYLLLLIAILYYGLLFLFFYKLPNVFRELEIDRFIQNYMLRNKMRDVIEDKLGHMISTDMSSIDPQSIKDEDASRLLNIWQKIKSEEKRNMYCTFGEEIFLACHQCLDIGDYTLYAFPFIAWDYLLAFILLGMTTSNTFLNRVNRLVHHSMEKLSGNHLALFTIFELEQQKRRSKARYYTIGFLIGFIVMELVMLLMADGYSNNLIGLDLPFLYEDLSRLRYGVLCIIFIVVWWYARPSTLTAHALQQSGYLQNTTVLANMIASQLEVIYQRMNAFDISLQAVIQDDPLREKYVDYQTRIRQRHEATLADPRYQVSMQAQSMQELEHTVQAHTTATMETIQHSCNE
jgi:hypothetical protein